MTPSLTEEGAFTALRSALVALLPAGTEVIQGQDNRVPMPGAANFVVMTSGRRQQMATNSHDYAPPTDPAPAAGTEGIARSTLFAFQLDVYGDAASDNAQVITTLIRDAWGVDQMKGSGFAPLYCEDPMQMPLIAGEQQWIERWTIQCALHARPVVTVPMQFADRLVTGLQEVK